MHVPIIRRIEENGDYLTVPTVQIQTNLVNYLTL